MTDKISSTDYRKSIHDLIGVERFTALKTAWKTASEAFFEDHSKLEVHFWELAQLYSEPWRKYHTLEHIVELTTAIHGVEGLTPEQKTYLTIAAFYHDAIYYPTSSTNEAESAELLKDHSSKSSSKDPSAVSRLSNLILMTKSHLEILSSIDPLDQLFLDLDMSILASHPDRYALYRRQVRNEYACYNDEQFLKGRLQFLKSLEGKKILRSSQFESLNEKNLINIKQEIQDLEANILLD